MYKIAFTVVFIREENKAYNWLNGEHIYFDDIGHPFLHILRNEIKNFEKFKYQGSYEDFEWLIDKKFIVSDYEEIKDVIRKEVLEEQKINSLNLILLPVNNACNFRCLYCYEDHELKKYMKDYEKTAIINFIRKQKPGKLHIEFFGGEPLLNKNFILNFLEELNELSQTDNFQFSASMTTNAFLLNINLFKKFIELGLKSFQITIDGVESDHNYLRPLANGKGSYNKIMNNLINISKLGNHYQFSIMIRVNFNAFTATKEKREIVLKKFKELFGNDNRFSYIFRAIGDYANANNFEIKEKEIILCEIDKSNSLKYSYEEEARAMGLMLSEYSLYLGSGSAECYAGKKNNMVIDSDLNVKKCTVALDNPINLVGHIDKSGEFIKNKNWELWTNDRLFEENKCSECFFISQCRSNNCRLKNILNNSLVCPNFVIDNKEKITKQILNYLETWERM